MKTIEESASGMPGRPPLTADELRTQTVPVMAELESTTRSARNRFEDLPDGEDGMLHHVRGFMAQQDPAWCRRVVDREARAFEDALNAVERALARAREHLMVAAPAHVALKQEVVARREKLWTFDADVPDRVADGVVGSSRVDLQACKLEYSIVSPK